MPGALTRVVLGLEQWREVGDSPAIIASSFRARVTAFDSSLEGFGRWGRRHLRYAERAWAGGMPHYRRSTHRFRIPDMTNRRYQNQSQQRGHNSRRAPTIIYISWNRIKQAPPVYDHRRTAFTHNAVATAQSRMDRCRYGGVGLPLDKPNQFLLEVTLPPHSFQIFNASEIVHNILGLAEVNLETEINETRSEG